MTKLFRLLFANLLFAPMTLWAADVTITVHNDTPTQRQELVEIDAGEVTRRLGVDNGTPFIVRNQMGQEETYQITHDGKLLIDAAVKPCGQTVFTVSVGHPAPKEKEKSKKTKKN